MRIVRLVNQYGQERLTKEDRLIYTQCLDVLICENMEFTYAEIKEIFAFIENSMHYYLRICAAKLLPRSAYEGCMENLLFLTGYLLHFYLPKVKKDYMVSLYDLAVHTGRFQPLDPEEYLDYVIRTGLLEKICFYIDYYYAR